MSKKIKRRINNPVAKFAGLFNHARTFKDRTKYDRNRDKRIIFDK